jgi:hypothetical protein
MEVGKELRPGKRHVAREMLLGCLIIAESLIDEPITPRMSAYVFESLAGINKAKFVYRVHPDGTGVRKALAAPVFLGNSVSPDGRWIVAWAPLSSDGSLSVQPFPLDGGTPIRTGGCAEGVGWSLDGRSVVIGPCLVALRPGEVPPQIPTGGFHSQDEIAHLPGAHLIEDNVAALGPSARVYASTKAPSSATSTASPFLETSTPNGTTTLVRLLRVWKAPSIEWRLPLRKRHLHCLRESDTSTAEPIYSFVNRTASALRMVPGSVSIQENLLPSGITTKS